MNKEDIAMSIDVMIAHGNNMLRRLGFLSGVKFWNSSSAAADIFARLNFPSCLFLF